MRSRWMTVAVAPVMALSISCSDGTGPDEGELEHLILAFCSAELPSWFAFQNEGGQWTRVQANGNNAFEFDATAKVGLALSYDFGNEWFTDVYFTSADEIRPLSGIACTETSGTKTVSGTVANVPAGSFATITMSGASDGVTGPNTSWTLSGVANNPQDLVAHREQGSLSTFTPNRVVIRRALNPLNNAVLPVIDFNSEGQAIATHTASITGLLSGETNTLDIEFATATGTNHLLYLSPTFSTSSQTIYGVPGGMTQTGDAHRIQLNADASTSYRSIVHWTRIPGDKAFALGAALANASVTPVASSPYARLRTTLPAQADYSSFVTAFFVQGTTRSFFVTVSAGYIDGAITTWTNEIPDLTPAGGFPTNAGLQNGTSTEWFIEAYDGPLASYIGGTPTDGATIRYAGRSSTTSTMQRNIVGAQHQRRPVFRRAFTP